jgi:predicted N-formylglutamate amidohydrolase
LNKPSIVLSCEHASNQVPLRYRSAINDDDVLASIEGWDIGALDIALAISEAIDAPCFAHNTTRLLVDVDRSLANPWLFSTYTVDLGDEDKQQILDKYYFPYRLRVENSIASLSKPVLHLSIHTFQSRESVPSIQIKWSNHNPVEDRYINRFVNNLSGVTAPVKIHFETVTKEHDSFISYLYKRFASEEYTGITLMFDQRLTEEGYFEETVSLLINSLSALSG